MDLFLQKKRPDDGSVEPKHVALNVFLTINWMCLTEKKICTLYILAVELYYFVGLLR